MWILLHCPCNEVLSIALFIFQVIRLCPGSTWAPQFCLAHSREAPHCMDSDCLDIEDFDCSSFFSMDDDHPPNMSPPANSPQVIPYVIDIPEKKKDDNLSIPEILVTEL